MAEGDRPGQRGCAPHGLYAPLGERLAEVRRIAVLRATPVGDFIESLPALQALRETYPEAHIALVGKPWQAAFLRGRPSPVDEVIVAPPLAGITAGEDQANDLAACQAFFAGMRARRFDLALQLHGGGRNSNPCVRSFGARVTAGPAALDAPRLDRWMPYPLLHHEGLRWLEAVSLVGASPCVPLEPRVSLIPADHDEAAQVCPADGRAEVLLQPGANDPRRRWDPARFAAVGDALAARGYRVLLNGTPEEAALTAAVARHMQQPAEDLAGRLSLGGLAGLLARCRLTISNDTGVAHLSRAVGTSTVTLYWIGNVVTHAPLSSARHRNAISWRVDCPACGQNSIGHDCGHPDSFIDDIAVGTVLDLATELLGTGDG